MSNPTLLHQEIEKVSPDKLAITLSGRLLTSTIMKEFTNSLNNLIGKSFYSGVDKVSFCYSKLTFIAQSDFKGTILERDGKVKIEMSDEFNIEGYFHLESDNSKVLSTALINVNSLSLDVDIDEVNLKIDSIKYNSNASINDSSDRESIIQQNSIDIEKLETLENWLIHFNPNSILDTFFSSEFEMSINKLYPSFALKAPLDYKVIENHLVVYPTNAKNIREIITCSVYDSTRGVDVNRTTTQVDRTTGSANWEIRIDDNSAPLDTRVIKNTDGDVGLYVPKPILEKSFTESIPSFSSKIKGRSILRYDGWLTTRLESVKFSIDTTNLALKTELTIGAHANINFTLKVKCVGTVDIGRGKTETVKPLKIWFNTYFMPDNDRLVGKSKITSLKVAEFKSKIELFSKWLSLAGGKGFIIGWFIDFLVGERISFEATRDSRKIAFEKINENNIVLIDLDEITEFFYSKYGNFASYSGTPNSAMFGLFNNIG